jgi:hypothetical protein
MKNAVFWDVASCESCKNRRFGRTYRLHHHIEKNRWYKVFVILRSLRRLLVTVNDVPSSKILVTLKMEALRSSETLVLTRAIRHNIPENDFLQQL